MTPTTLLLASLLAASGPGPAGTWTGQWVREGSALEVEVTFAREGDAWAGSFSADALRVAGIPFSNVHYAPPALSWDLVGDATTMRFSGTIEGDTISGSYREGDATGTFTLARSTAAVESIAEVDVSFASGDVALAGTVLLPPGEGPCPGVVFLHGSGAEGRWASRFLARAFARRGVAALVWDKRGVGGSTGDWRAAGFEELTDDAASAVAALRAQPRIDAARVGVHGHSQGGTLAPWVAAEVGDLAFVVASAGGGLSMAETEVYSVGNAIGLAGLPEEERVLAERYVAALVATAYEGAPRAELDAAWEAVRDRPWAFAPPPESSHYWAFSRKIAAYDALAHWRRVTAPALLVYGEGDERVPPRPSAAAIAGAYLGGSGVRLDVSFFPGADHTFRLRPPRDGAFAWPRTAPGYPDRVVDWVLDVTRR